jgi:hemerythrin-like domain-containing protein
MKVNKFTFRFHKLLSEAKKMSLAVIHLLKHEHRVIEQVLRALEGVGFRLICEAEMPVEALSEIVDFMSQFVDGYHHAKEETYLFPALQRQGIVREGGPLGIIEREHQSERQLIDQLSKAIQDLKAGSEASKQIFTRAANQFVAHLTNHMQQEEAILLRLAEELFDPSDDEAVEKGFCQAEKEFGESTVKRYENLARTLEAKWAL